MSLFDYIETPKPEASSKPPSGIHKLFEPGVPKVKASESRTAAKVLPFTPKAAQKKERW